MREMRSSSSCHMLISVAWRTGWQLAWMSSRALRWPKPSQVSRVCRHVVGNQHGASTASPAPSIPCHWSPRNALKLPCTALPSAWYVPTRLLNRSGLAVRPPSTGPCGPPEYKSTRTNAPYAWPIASASSRMPGASLVSMLQGARPHPGSGESSAYMSSGVTPYISTPPASPREHPPIVLSHATQYLCAPLSAVGVCTLLRSTRCTATALDPKANHLASRGSLTCPASDSCVRTSSSTMYDVDCRRRYTLSALGVRAKGLLPWPG
mmetsp:Transcript_16116/g.49242  ORF Transcript_16116/g.49242 Transcript_16116/m.49242 type:complete len:265 (-) Transcript_16116:641-1435(-)